MTTALLPLPLDSTETAILRRFNRMYTRFIGTLNEGLLQTEFTLAEARVLYELATRTASNASEIAETLSLDPGYLSRLLGKLEQNGLLRREASEIDARSARLLLTPRGRAAFKKLNALSEQQAQTVLQSLPNQARIELIQSMQSIEGILAKTTPNQGPLVLRPHRVGDMGWVVYSETLGYAQQFGWNEEFEALVAQITAEFIANFDPSRERCWVAEIDGRHIGHIFLVKHPTEAHTAKLRLLYVDPSARGMGVGDTLVKECLRYARAAGYSNVVLWTQSILVAAHRIYQRAGFKLVKEECHFSFGKQLIGQEWELKLI
jgi:DNA-binding MarR family transcriptional regulator/GNAT superfamily N-acetyltransferase